MIVKPRRAVRLENLEVQGMFLKGRKSEREEDRKRNIIPS